MRAGGQTQISPEGYIEGTPDWGVEIAVVVPLLRSNRFGVKLKDWEP